MIGSEGVMSGQCTMYGPAQIRLCAHQVDSETGRHIKEDQFHRTDKTHHKKVTLCLAAMKWLKALV